MKKQVEFVTEVSKLQHFPYKTSEELWQAFMENKIHLGVAHGFAREWATRARRSPIWLRVVTTIFEFMSYIISN